MRRLSPLAGALVVGVLLTSRAHAHPGHSVLRSERYLKIEVSRDEARVVLSLTLGPPAMYQVLAAADAAGDGDGTVSDAEASAYLTKYAHELRQELPIDLDGARVAVPWTDPYLTPTGPVRIAAGAVELVARVPLDGGRHVLAVHDRMGRDVAERTDVAFRALNGGELLATGLGAKPGAVTADVAYGPPLASTSGEDDTLTAVIRVPGTSHRTRTRAVLGAVALVILAAGSLFALRRRGASRKPRADTGTPR